MTKELTTGFAADGVLGKTVQTLPQLITCVTPLVVVMFRIAFHDLLKLFLVHLVTRIAAHLDEVTDLIHPFCVISFQTEFQIEYAKRYFGPRDDHQIVIDDLG